MGMDAIQHVLLSLGIHALEPHLNASQLAEMEKEQGARIAMMGQTMELAVAQVAQDGKTKRHVQGVIPRQLIPVCHAELHVQLLHGFLVILEIHQVIKARAIHKLLDVSLFAEMASLNAMKNVRIRIRFKTMDALINASFHGDMEEDKQESFLLTFT